MTLPLNPSEKAAAMSEMSALLGALFAPRSIAVIGASADPTRFTGKIIPTLQRHGYGGAIYPVNPRRSEIGGLTAYPTLGDIPGTVDCVVYGIGAAHVMGVLEECARKAVKLVVIASAGFAETGTEAGKRLQAEVVAFARANGIRVLGPNGIGFGNFVDRAIVSAAAVMEWPDIPRGRIGLVTQSGGLGLATVAYCAFEEGISFSHLISTGNEADLDTIEIANFFVDDPATDVIAMTIEAVKEPARFIALLERAGAVHKPVVVLKSGRSDLGKTMAASHTGALAGQAAVFEMVCRRYGVTVADDVDDFYQIASMFAKLRAAGKLQTYKAPGEHCAALSLSGGHVGLFADHGSLAGLRFPALSDATKAALAEALGFEGHFQNPLDTTAQVIGDDAFWGRCVRVLMDSDDIQAVVPIITVAHSYDNAIRDFIAIAGEREEVIVVCWAGGSFVPADRALLRDSLVPVFRTPSRAAAGLRALNAYCAVWNRSEAPAVEDLPPSPAEARDLLRTALAEGRRTLTENESKRILGAVGLPVTRETAVTSAEDAQAAARAIGFPVVVKGEHPEILHKSEAGLVLLNVADEAAVAAAFDTVWQRMQAHPSGAGAARVLIQELVRPAQELILGVNTDPEFGPVVVVGIGGIFVEIMHDVSMRLPPFGRSEARAMLEDLRGVSLMKGARGRLPVDLDALADLISRFSVFVDANRDLIAEVDINPLVCVDGAAAEFRMLDGLILLKDAP